MALVFLNGSFLREEEARVSVRDRGFRYGDGIFETIAIYDSVIYQWKLHQERMKKGAKLLNLSISSKEIFLWSQQLIRKNKAINGILRIIVTRGNGGRGYLPPTDYQNTVLLETLPFPKKQSKPIKLWLSSVRKTPNLSIPSGIKTMQGMNSILARMEAEENGCDESLMLGIDNKICECSGSNIFWIKNNKLFTPSVKTGILEGTTRKAVIRISDLAVNEGKFLLSDMEDADEVFITNVATGILPVKILLPVGIKWSSHKKTLNLALLLKKDIEQYVVSKKTALG